MSVQIHIFLFIIVANFLYISFAFNFIKGFWHRLSYCSFLAGVFFFSGIGAAYIDVPSSYFYYYLLFTLSFTLSFIFFTISLPKVGCHSSKVLTRFLSDIDHQKGWDLVVVVYILLHLVPFLVPVFRINELFNPQPPDLISAWRASFDIQKTNFFVEVARYIRSTLTPFFFIGIFKYRFQVFKTILIFLLLLYIKYVDNSYIGKTDMPLYASIVRADVL